MVMHFGVIQVMLYVKYLEKLQLFTWELTGDLLLLAQEVVDYAIAYI